MLVFGEFLCEGFAGRRTHGAGVLCRLPLLRVLRRAFAVTATRGGVVSAGLCDANTRVLRLLSRFTNVQ